MQRPQAVREARVFGALISVETESQLLDPPQSLKLGRIDQANHQASFGVCIAQRNDVVNRISIESWGQVLLGPYSIDGFCSLPHDAGQGGPKRPALALGIVSDSAIPLLRLNPSTRCRIHKLGHKSEFSFRFQG